MSNIKFTSDGKKVAIVGKLNSQETIVQEIFVQGESEIPSGEHFVVKSLHDAPAVSWKESELKKLEERYRTDKEKFESEIKDAEKKYRAKTLELRKKLEYISSAINNDQTASIQGLIDYVTGAITHVVIWDYRLEILTLDEFNQTYEDKLRLISLFGKDDGSFSYAIGDYYDHSGGHKRFYPFKDIESAKEKLAELIAENHISQQSIDAAKKYRVNIPAEKLKAYYDSSRAMYEKKVIELEEKLKVARQEINDLPIIELHGM